MSQQRYFDFAQHDPRLKIGLVGHWLSTTSGEGLPPDRSGNGRNITGGTNPLPTTFGLNRFSNGSSFYFPGGTCYYSMTTASPSSNEMTFCAWVNKGSAAQLNAYVFGTTGSTQVLNFKNAGTIQAGNLLAHGSWSYTDSEWLGQWRHICLTKTQIGGLACELFFDGISQGSVTTSLTSTPIARIGGGGTGSTFNGFADDLRVYSRVLSGPEILLLANRSYEYVITPRRTGLNSVSAPAGGKKIPRHLFQISQ